MASTGKPAPADLPEILGAVLGAFPVAGARLCLGFSGGLDSTVLLHLLVRLRASLGFQLRTVHVHHGLSRHADDWLHHCETLCRGWAVPFQGVRVAVPRTGKGIEAAARAVRYQVYAEQAAEYIVLAHQRDDQGETLLLNLLRGSGVHGLAAMPVRRPLAGSHAQLLRPLLGVSRGDLEAYAHKHGLSWIEDESNQDSSFARNLLRLEVMPRLQSHFPGCATTLARTAEHMAESGALLDELAGLDLGADAGRDELELSRLGLLSRARQANALRYHLRLLGLPVPSAAALEVLQSQIPRQREAGDACSTGDTEFQWHLGGQVLRVWRDRLYLTGQLPATTPNRLPWRGESSLGFAGGRVCFEPVEGQGISRLALVGKSVALGLRQGGERLQTQANRPRRALKKILRESAIPPWERARFPLLFVDEDLVWVAGVGVDARYQAQPGEPGWVMAWHPPPPRP